MKILIIIVIIVIIIYNLAKDSTGTGPTPTGTGDRGGNKAGISVSFGGKTPQSYSSVLNRLEQDVHYIANYTYGYGEISVVVTVQKTDSTYCTVGGSFLADVSFNGVSFQDGYNFDGNDHVLFETKLATGFTSLEDVKREILLQFNWSDLPVYNENFTILNHGDYINKPYISYSFTVKR